MWLGYVGWLLIGGEYSDFEHFGVKVGDEPFVCWTAVGHRRFSVIIFATIFYLFWSSFIFSGVGGNVDNLEFQILNLN